MIENHFGPLFGDHCRGCIGVTTRNLRHDGCVNHANVFNPAQKPLAGDQQLIGGSSLDPIRQEDDK